MNQSNCPSNAQGSACCRCCLQLTIPAQGQALESLTTIMGIADACETVFVCIDNHAPLQASADCCGRFQVSNPYPLASGTHRICVRTCHCACRVCHSFVINRNQNAIPQPTIDTPSCGSTIADPEPWMTGRGIPGYIIRVCLDNYACQTTTVDQSGEYRVNLGVSLPNGSHTLTVTQLAPGGSSQPRTCTFTVDTSDLLIEPIEARMGESFRTVDVDVLASGRPGLATVYYLLLSPGSPAPTPAQIMNYTNTANLLSGSAATGSFTVDLTAQQTTYTWSLTGLDKPNAPEGTTGVVDGYNYEVFLYVTLGGENSGVLTFGSTAMGMPFASGLGTADAPFTIRELSPEELQTYPDLLAGNPLNRPEVDENARMLENIERLVTLYDETNGVYGLEDSMTYHHQMSSNLDLAGYAAAYNGEGWESIGDIDGYHSHRKKREHLFSGVFDGAGYSITNLSITPTASATNFVGYRGLFGGVEEGTIKNLTLSGVTIDAFATPPGQAQIGSFISIARNPTLTGLTLQDANIQADIGPITIEDTHAVNIGGFVGKIFEGGTVRTIHGENISITVPSNSALALGGFVGFTDKFDATDRFESIDLSNLTISGFALIGGLAGYMVYGVNSIKDVAVRQISLTAPGGEAGGLIGRLYVYGATGDGTIEDCSVQTLAINGNGLPGAKVGGLIGTIEQYPFSALVSHEEEIFHIDRGTALPTADPWPMTTVQHCSVSEGTITATDEVGGLIGRVSMNQSGATGRTLVTLCKTQIEVTALDSSAGGLIGFSRSLAVTQSFTARTVTSVSGLAGGLIGFGMGSHVSDCYATGTSGGGSDAGGNAGTLSASKISSSYSTGAVTATDAAGGIAGTASSTTVTRNLVLGGTMTGAMAHRILGVKTTGGAPSSNYALNTVIPVPDTPDPNGLDGGSIEATDILSTMQTLNWDTTAIWNIASIASLGRPTLLQNPE